MLSEKVNCHVTNMCTGVQCCIENDLIQRTIEFSLLLDPCTNRLSISIERSRYNRTLGDFDYGMFLIGVKKSLYDVLITEKLVLQTGCQYTFGLG